MMRSEFIRAEYTANLALVALPESPKPGPWRVEVWSGGEGYTPGFYVARTNRGRNEWMKTRDGKAARKFNTRAAAVTAILNSGIES